MKKNKLVGLAALVLSLGMVGCGETKDDVEPCEKHTWGTKEVLKEATCTEEGQSQRTCTVCGAKEDVKTISKKSHVYEDAPTLPGNVAATCTAKGVKVQKCKNCDSTKNVDIDMIPHTYAKDADGNEIITWETAPTCTAAGVGGKRHCTACDQDYTYEQDALGHTYAKDDDGNDIVDWTGEGYGHATCLAAGKGHKACTRCQEVADVPEAQLDHNFQLVGTPTPRPEGSDKATVNMYSCDKGCNATSFGFQANEVTQRSVSKLVIGEDGGARFWGRPIGNDVVLNESGDPDENSHDAVFNKEQLGDFFEYEFDLTAEQVATMGDTQRLYCEATAAQWMSNSNMDFWACKSGDTDWTRGLYIETTDTHNEGDEIDDYRYILYVDDQPKDFDSRIKVPARSNTQKVEYVLPYEFHLHEGTNKIRLVMAGGYRSVFYKFTFRPAEALPEPSPIATIARDDASVIEKDGKAYLKIGGATEDAANTIKADKPYVNFQNVNGWTNTGHGANPAVDLPYEYDVTGATGAAGGKAYLLVDISSLVSGGNYNCHIDLTDFDTMNAAGQNSKNCPMNNAFDKVYTVGDKTYELVSVPGGTAGANTDFWGNLGIRVRDVDAEATVTLNAADCTEGQKAPVATDKNTRLGKNIFDDVWDISAVAPGTYALYINAQASSGNATNGYWNSKTAVAKGDSEANNGGADLCQLYKYTVKVGEGEAINMGGEFDNFAASGLTDKGANWTNVSLAIVTIAEGDTTLTIHNNNNGYSIWVFAAKLVKIA